MPCILEAVDKVSLATARREGAGGIHCRREAPEWACLHKLREAGFVINLTPPLAARYFYMGREQNLTLGTYPYYEPQKCPGSQPCIAAAGEQGKKPRQARKIRQEEQLVAFAAERRIARGETHPDSFGAIAEDWLADVEKAMRRTSLPAPQEGRIISTRFWPRPATSPARAYKISTLASNSPIWMIPAI